MPIWSDVGSGGTKDKLLYLPSAEGKRIEGKRPDFLELEGQGKVQLLRGRRRGNRDQADGQKRGRRGNSPRRADGRAFGTKTGGVR